MKNFYLRNQLVLFKLSWLLILLVFFSSSLNAQVVTQTESVEGNFFPMPGWKTRRGIVAEFSRVAAASTVSPTVPALANGTASTGGAVAAVSGGGTNVIMLNSFVSATDTAFLISKPFDFSNNAGVNPILSFWVYRDAGAASANDRLEVFWSGVSPGPGATLTAINHQSGSNVIPRLTSATPAAINGAGWYEYRFTIPTAAPYNTRRNYFVIKGITALGNNMYLDKFTVNTYPNAMLASDVQFDLVQQNNASTSAGVTNQWVVGVRCVVGGNSGCGALSVAGTNNPIKLDSLLFNTNGCSNISTDILNAKVYYTGGRNQFSISYVSPFPATTGIAGASYPKTIYGTTLTGGAIATNLDFQNSTGNCFYLEYDTTYFWLVYDLKSTAVGANYIDGDFRGAVVGGPTTCPSPSGSATCITATTTTYTLSGSIKIDIPYCTPTYTYGTEGIAANYTNNDYVAGVSLIGYGGTNIGNGVNLAIQSVPNNPNTQAGLPPNLGCQPFCPFTAHPPDYEFRNPAIAGNTVTLQQGVTYSITVKVGTANSGNGIAAWIDFNRDGIFDNGTMTWAGTPAQIAAGTGTYTGERLGFASLLANQTATFTFTVPAAGAIPAPYTGVTRLRVREWTGASTTSMDPCSNGSYGEVEDFDITIIPNCSASYKLWLGNTDDWSNPANWCPSVPTITDSTVINKTLVSPGSRPYFYPVIKSGVTANCKSLIISSQDSLYIDSPSPSATSLNIAENLNNSGYINVVGNKTPINNAVFPNSSGTLLNINMTPLCAKTYKAAQTQIIYLASDLISLGLRPQDRITKIQLTVKNVDASPRTYNNFNIGYICSAAVPNQFASTVPLTGVLNAYTSATQQIVTGLNEFTLGTPIVWDGTSNLLIQYTFSNAGGNGRANNDFIDITQSTGRNSTLLLGRLATSVATTPVVGSFTGQVPGPPVDITANGSPIANALNLVSQFNTLRPNATFVWERPYGKPKLVVKGNFTNNGLFNAGKSLFVMDGALTQRISGTRAIPFYTFCMAKSSANRPIILNNDTVSIQDTFFLGTGQMIMNGKPLYMTWSNPAAFSRLIQGPTVTAGTGLLISENPNSIVNWTIGNYVVPASLRTIPFGNRMDTTNATPAITYIPLTFTHKSGDMGVFKAGTKYWLGNSIPYPPTATHINGFNFPTSNAANVVDRYWMIGKTGPQNPAANFPVADITFRFSSNNTAPQVTERPSIFSTLPARPGYAQPWRVSDYSWLRITTSTAITYTVNSAVGNGTTITYTTSALTNFVPGQLVNITGMSPAGFNLVGAVVTAVTTVSPFTFTVANTLVATSTLGGTATMTPLTGGPTYNQAQTSLSYTQTYTQVAATTSDSVRVVSWDWPTVPAFTIPNATPAGPIGDFAPWTIATAANPLGNGYTPPVVTTDSIINATCTTGSTGKIYIRVNSGTAPYTYLWNDGVTTKDRLNVAAGNYTVTVTDAASLTSSLVINVGVSTTPPILTLDSIVFACYSSNNGKIYITTTGTTSPFTYAWSNGTTTEDQNNLSIGQYVVTVTGCNGVTTGGSYWVLNPLIFMSSVGAISGQNPICAGDDYTYSISSVLNATNYLWSVPSGASIVSGQGTTSIVVHFDNGYTSGSVSVTASNSCNTSNNSLQVTAYAFTMNAYLMSITGSTSVDTVTNYTYNVNSISGALNYQWNVPAGVSIISGQGTTALVVKFNSTFLTGSLSCSALTNCNYSLASSSISIVSLTGGCPTMTASITNVSCSGGNNGSINLTVSGDTANTTNTGLLISELHSDPSGNDSPFEWVELIATKNIDFSVTPYTVVVANNGSATTKGWMQGGIAFPAPANSTYAFLIDTGIVVKGEVVYVGGTLMTPTGKKLRTKNTSTENGDGGIGGPYLLTGVLGNGGGIADGVAVFNKPVSQLDSNSVPVDAVLFGSGIGAAALADTSKGFVLPNNDRYSGGHINASSFLAPDILGRYSLEATGSYNASLGTFITPRTWTTTTSAGVSSVSNINLSTVNYVWSNGATSKSLIGLTAGNYTVTATSASGCTITNTYSVTQPDSLNVNLTITNPSCSNSANGSVIVNVTGGTAPYIYLWSTNSTLSSINNLVGGNYTLTVTDSKGCIKTSNVTIVQPFGISVIVNLISNVTCFGGNNGSASALAINGAGNYTYLWSSSATTSVVNNLTAGLFTVTATDQNGCTASNTITVTQPTALQIAFLKSDVVCNGGANGSVTANVSGGVSPYTYLWSNGAVGQTISNLMAGTYVVTIIDDLGCVKTDSVTISQPNAVTVTIPTSTNLICFGTSTGSATALASNGVAPYSYLWSNGGSTATINNLSTGVYTVTATDANGCSAINTTSITQPTALTVNIGISTNVLCNGGASGTATGIASNGTAGYTYQWNTGATTATINNLSAGSYTITATDANGCYASATVNITQPSAISVNGTVVNVNCSGSSTGSIALNVSGGAGSYSYLWSNGANASSIISLVAGAYTVTVTDANNCTQVKSFNVIQSTAITGTFTKTNVSCFGGNNGSLTINASGGTAPYNYAWAIGATTATITNRSAGTYTVTVTDALGCTNSFSSTITQPNQLVISPIITNVSCNGGNNGSISTTTLGGNTPYTYLWSNGKTTSTINSLTAGFYTLTVTDASSCTMQSSITVTQPPALDLMLTANGPICNGSTSGTITSVVSGGTSPYTYLWSNASTSQNLSGVAAGTYAVTVTDSKGCSLTQSKTISQQNAILISSVNPYGNNINYPVTIKGNNFTGVNSVKFNGVSSSNYFVNSDSSISATVPSGATTGPVLLSNTNGCSGQSAFDFNVLTNFSSLNLKLFIEGFYLGSQSMDLPLVNSGLSGNPIATDSIEALLYDTNDLYNPIERKKSLLNSSGYVDFTFPGYLTGGSYWISIKTRNALETWSKTAVPFYENTYYNFSGAKQFPIVTTKQAQDLTLTSTTSGGTIINNGGDSIIAKGICWSTNPNPTIALTTKTVQGGGSTAFSSTMNGLIGSTTYYVRAYATNSIGTAYGNQIKFVKNANIPLMDIDSNIYDTVVIGNQIWMKQNLKVSRYRNGDPIPTGLSNTSWSSTTSGAYSIYNNLAINDSIYGKLYNWYAVADPRGLCPSGWHVPDYCSWYTLENQLGGSLLAGGKLKEVGLNHWASPNVGASDSVGFTGLPGGYRGLNVTNLSYFGIGYYGVWWSADGETQTTAYAKSLYNLGSDLLEDIRDRPSGLSVRCIKDLLPSSIIDSVTNINYNSAKCIATITSEGGDCISSKGFVWSTTPSPTIALVTKTINGYGVGSFSDVITGLTPNTTYYIRTYAVNNTGVGYGNEVSITTTNSPSYIPADIDGNVYDTVIIGNQTWLKQNLKVTRYRNGDTISTGLSNSSWIATYNGAYAVYNDSSIYSSVYGNLYNWYAIADPRGLCPINWHVPSNLEWNTLEYYLGGLVNAGYQMKESGVNHWPNPYYGNNSSGFTALPGGLRFGLNSYPSSNDGNCFDIRSAGFWWSITPSPYTTYEAWYRSINIITMEKNHINKTFGLSVRCIKD